MDKVMNDEQIEEALTLLKATFELLKKQDESCYVLKSFSNCNKL